MNESAGQANLSVIISNLPEGVTIKQICDFCSTAGALSIHPTTGDPLILFNPQKHKATVTFSYPEGANNAIAILNGSNISDENSVTVTRAPQEPFDFSEWKSDMKRQRKYHSYMGNHEEELSAKEQKQLKCMVLRNVFTYKEMRDDPQIFGRIIKDWTEICSKFGKVTLVKPMEYHPDGVVIVRFDSPEAAARATGELDSYEYNGKEISTEPWDGTDLSCRETDEQEQERFEHFMEQLGDPNKE